MTRDLLLELGAEELPAAFVVPALDDMERVFTEKCAAARLGLSSRRCASDPPTYRIPDPATPRAAKGREVTNGAPKPFRTQDNVPE